MKDTINQSEWDNRKNWSVLTYSSSKDSRLFVPKRNGFGWTINFGHSGGKFAFGAFLALPVLAFSLIWVAFSHYGKR
jgi:uncharacterized membrane protein